MRVAFIIHRFPQTSEVFIINQVADLIDRGIDVQIFAFEQGDPATVSDRYREYRMAERTHSIGAPHPRAKRILGGVVRAVRLLTRNPALLIRALDWWSYSSRARSLQMLYAADVFNAQKFDVVHCHFGKMANQYLPIRRMMRHTMPMLTSFYGNDVSHMPKVKGLSYYDALKRECHRYIVMSNNMKERVIKLGFPENELMVLPVSIQVDELPFAERIITDDERMEIISVGRFVEKKGIDDLLRALAIVKQEATRPFHCTVVGGGELEPELKGLTAELGIEDVVSFPGFVKLEEVIRLFLKSHLYLQPSKTAANGDME